MVSAGSDSLEKGKCKMFLDRLYSLPVVGTLILPASPLLPIFKAHKQTGLRQAGAPFIIPRTRWDVIPTFAALALVIPFVVGRRKS